MQLHLVRELVLHHRAASLVRVFLSAERIDHLDEPENVAEVRLGRGIAELDATSQAAEVKDLLKFPDILDEKLNVDLALVGVIVMIEIEGDFLFLGESQAAIEQGTLRHVVSDQGVSIDDALEDGLGRLSLQQAEQLFLDLIDVKLQKDHLVGDHLVDDDLGACALVEGLSGDPVYSADHGRLEREGGRVLIQESHYQV